MVFNVTSPHKTTEAVSMNGLGGGMKNGAMGTQREGDDQQRRPREGRGVWKKAKRRRHPAGQVKEAYRRER